MSKMLQFVNKAFKAQELLSQSKIVKGGNKKGNLNYFGVIAAIIILCVLVGLGLMLFQSFKTTDKSSSATYDSINMTIETMTFGNDVLQVLIPVSIAIAIIGIIIVAWRIITRKGSVG